MAVAYGVTEPNWAGVKVRVRVRVRVRIGLGSRLRLGLALGLGLGSAACCTSCGEGASRGPPSKPPYAPTDDSRKRESWVVPECAPGEGKEGLGVRGQGLGLGVGG